MKRRALLASIAGTTLLGGAGCAALSPCRDASISEGSAEVDVDCGRGTVLEGHVTGRVDGCSGPVTFELAGDDRAYASESVEPGPDSQTVHFHERDAGVGAGNAVTAQIRSPRGIVVAEQPVEVDHYDDQPPSLSLEQPRLDSETVETGASVAATVRVSNTGTQTPFEARLLADDEPVATEEGTIYGSEDCSPGTAEVTLSTAFDAAGEYELELAVTPTRDRGYGSSASLGTVTVRSHED